MTKSQITLPSGIICVSWLIFFTSITIIEPAYADPTFTTKYKSFRVSGNSIEDIWRSIYQNGPKSNLGIGHAGYTTFKFDNSVGIVPKGGVCTISSIKFKLISTVQLPKWTSKRTASKNIQIYWEALESDVKRHENDHVRIAEESIDKLYRTLSAIRPQKNCSTLKKKIKNEISKSERVRNRAQNSFERKEIRAQNKRLAKLIEQVRSKYQ